MEKKKRNALRRLGYTLAGLAGAVALLAGVGLSGAGLIRAQRGERAEHLLAERYGEPFTVDRVYGRSAGIGYDLWPFILMEEHYTVAAHSDAFPEMMIRADVNVRDTSLRAALGSRLFRELREGGYLKEEHPGGCTLFDKKEQVERILASESNS